MNNLNSEEIIITGNVKKGMFGKILTGRFRNQNDSIVAIKSFKGEFLQGSEEFFNDQMRELQRIDHHENIVDTIGYYIFHYGVENNKRIKFCVVMKYEGLYVRGRWINDLLTYLIHLREELGRKKRGVFDKDYEICPKEELHSFAIMIAKGCEYLETNRIIIGDLSAKNVLINQNKVVKLADFSFSGVKQLLVKHRKVSEFSYRHSAPEVISDWTFSKESDIWSYGIVIWEIKTLGGVPFSSKTLQEMINLSSILELESNVRVHSSQRYVRLLKNCLCPFKAGRLSSFTDILKILTNADCFGSNDVVCEIYESYQATDLDSLPMTEEQMEENTSKPLEIYRDEDYKLVTKLGHGIFGSVCRLKIKQGRPVLLKYSDFAVKRLNNSTTIDTNSKILSQKLQKFQQNNNVVRVFSYWSPKGRVNMEYQSVTIEEEDGLREITGLENYLKHLRTKLKKGSHLDSQEFAWIAVQIARGMVHLHKLNIFHGNLAARNILINDAKTIKITDFFAPIKDGRLLNEELLKKQIQKELFTRWASPEVIRKSNCTIKSDIWSFGIVLWEIATLGAYPFAQYKPHEFLVEISDRTIIQPYSITGELWIIMDCCWKLQPEIRPNFEGVYLMLDTSMATNKLQFEFGLDDIERFPTKEEFINDGKKLTQRDSGNEAAALVPTQSSAAEESYGSPISEASFYQIIPEEIPVVLLSPPQFVYNTPPRASHSFVQQHEYTSPEGFTTTVITSSAQFITLATPHPGSNQPHGSYFPQRSPHQSISPEYSTTAPSLPSEFVLTTPPRPRIMGSKNQARPQPGGYTQRSPRYFSPFRFESPSRPIFPPRNISPTYRNTYCQAVTRGRVFPELRRDRVIELSSGKYICLDCGAEFKSGKCKCPNL